MRRRVPPPPAAGGEGGRQGPGCRAGGVGVEVRRVRAVPAHGEGDSSAKFLLLRDFRLLFQELGLAASCSRNGIVLEQYFTLS